MKRDDKTSRRNHCVDLQNGADDSPALELGPLLAGVGWGAWLLPTAWVYWFLIKKATRRRSSSSSSWGKNDEKKGGKDKKVNGTEEENRERRTGEENSKCASQGFLLLIDLIVNIFLPPSRPVPRTSPPLPGSFHRVCLSWCGSCCCASNGTFTQPQWQCAATRRTPPPSLPGFLPSSCLRSPIPHLSLWQRQ